MTRRELHGMEFLRLFARGDGRTDGGEECVWELVCKRDWQRDSVCVCVWVCVCPPPTAATSSTESHFLGRRFRRRVEKPPRPFGSSARISRRPLSCGRGKRAAGNQKSPTYAVGFRKMVAHIGCCKGGGARCHHPVAREREQSPKAAALRCD